MADNRISLLSDADVLALRDGNMTKMSDAGLKIMRGDTSFIGGALQGARELIDAPAQLLERGVRTIAPGAADWLQKVTGSKSAEEATQSGRRDIANLVGANPSTAGQVAGNIAGTVATAGVTRLPQLVGAALPRAAAQYASRNPYKAAAATGAVAAPLTQYADVAPDAPQSEFWKEKAAQAALGAPGAVAGRGIAQGIGRRLQGARPNANAQLLLDEGVQLTPAQIMGGAVRTGENAATSTPFLGSAITGAYQRGHDSLNRALYRRALDPIGRGGLITEQTEPGRAAVRMIRDQLGSAYDSVLSRTIFQADQEFLTNLAQIRTMTQALPQEMQQLFDHTMQRTLRTRITPQGMASGDAIKAVDSELARTARIYRGSPDGTHRELGAAIDAVRQEIRQALIRANPREAANLQAIDQGYAQYALLRRATGYQGANEGVFSPAQLSSAVRAGDWRTGKGGFATGTALGQDLSDAAKAVMQSKIPDSGTAGRSMMGATMMGLLHPASLAIPAAMSQLYRPGAQQFINRMMLNPPQVLQRTGRALERGPSELVGAEIASGQ